MREIKMSKVLLMVMALIMVVSVPVQAVGESFTDVKEGSWYYPYIEEIQRRGVVDGYEDGTFRPENTVTKAEATKMLVEAKTGGDIEIVESEIAWYTKYLSYGYGVGIQYDEAKVNEAATRAEVSEYIVKIFRTEEEIAEIEVKGNLSDTDNKYMEYLHKIGVIQGYTEVDGKPVVKPEGQITRAEIVKMLHVMLELEEGPGFVEDTSLGEEMKERKAPRELYKHELKHKSKNPRTNSQLRAEILDMMLEGETERVLKYTDIEDSSEMKEITEATKEAFSQIYQTYPEISTYTNGARYKMQMKGSEFTYTINLERRGIEQRGSKSAAEMKREFYEDAQKVYDRLVEGREITGHMTEREKAKKLYEWVILNSEYTDSDYLENHTGYEQLKTGKVVCQGYVSTYNYLLRLAGVEEVEGVVGKTKMSGSAGHIWTKATLDGESVYIDPTFGDRGGDRQGTDKVNWKYFGMSENEIRQTHIW